MSNTNQKSSQSQIAERNLPWEDVEEVSVRIAIVRDVLRVQNMAMHYADECVGGYADEMDSFLTVLDDYMKRIENRCQYTCERLRMETVRKEVS